MHNSATPRALPSALGQVQSPSTPTVVDEITVRVVAALVLAIGMIALATGQWWLYAALAFNFAIRAIRGPRRSPLALAARRIRSAIPASPKPTAYAPKRFAAAIGLACTAAITVAWIANALTASSVALGLAWVIALAMLISPALEAGLGLCVGCRAYAALVRAGLASPDVCVDCTPLARA